MKFLPDVAVRRLRAIGREDVFANRFVIEGEAGAGGSGSVYRAIDGESDRTVALKILHRAVSSPRDASTAR